MLRIQLVIEDYGELIGLQTLLKKLGFDVDATQNSIGLSDQLLALNPDVVIMTGFGRKVAGYELNKQVRKVRGLPHVLLSYDVGQAPVEDPAVAGWLSTPIDGGTLIDVVARLCGLNEKVLREKYGRHLKEPISTEMPEFGRLAASTLPADERRARYQRFLKSEPPADHGFTAGVVREQVKALRQAETEDDQADLERERREFVAQLFKKA